ncbi:hypothetical protein WME91_03250 [Sorangium sp. So ce269]
MIACGVELDGEQLIIARDLDAAEAHGAVAFAALEHLAGGVHRERRRSRDAIMAAHGETFDLLLGRRTYDIWSGYWPKAPSSPIADRLNAATKYRLFERTRAE